MFNLGGGQFLYGNGAPIANGSLVLTLSVGSATVIATGANAPTSYTFSLDANGVILGDAVLWGNAELTPQGTTYSASVYDVSNNLVWGPMNWIVGPSYPYQGTLYPNIIVNAVTLLTGQVPGGIPASNGSFSLSGWGSGAAVSSTRGWDYAHEFTVTSGSGPSSSPTITYTFANGSQTHPPIVIVDIVGGTGQRSVFNITVTSSSYTLTFQGTPQPGVSYVVHVMMSTV